MSAQLDEFTNWSAPPGVPTSVNYIPSYVPQTEVKTKTQPWWESGTKIFAVICGANFLAALWLILLNATYNASFMVVFLIITALLSFICAFGNHSNL